MNVICINNLGIAGQDLTIGKKYFIIDEEYDDIYKRVKIKNDIDEEDWYFTHRFIPLSEHRRTQLNKLLSDE